MMKSNLFEMNEHEILDQTSQVKALSNKLEKVKQRLWVLLGAVIMFLILVIAEPGMDGEAGTFIWFFILGIGLVNGIVMGVSAKWRLLPLPERRNCVFGSFAISLLAFGFLPLYLLINFYDEAVLFGFLFVIGGCILAVFYLKTGISDRDMTESGEEMFP